MADFAQSLFRNPGLIVVSWLLIRFQPMQEPLFRCELASVNCHCGDASNSSLLHGICFLGGLPVDALALLAWQWYLSSRTQHHNFQRLPPIPRGAIMLGGLGCVWDTHCGGAVIASPDGDVYGRAMLLQPLTFWLDRLWTPQWLARSNAPEVS